MQNDDKDGASAIVTHGAIKRLVRLLDLICIPYMHIGIFTTLSDCVILNCSSAVSTHKKKFLHGLVVQNVTQERTVHL